MGIGLYVLGEMHPTDYAIEAGNSPYALQSP